jgi:hypothetical protein
MKNLIRRMIILSTVFGAISCSDDDGFQNDGLFNEQIYEEVTPGANTGVKLDGIGVELDPHFFSQNLTRNDGAETSDWEVVTRRVKAMQIHQFRVMLLPHWWEPVNDNNDPDNADISKYTFDSEEMQSLYKVLDLAQENDVKVTVVVWGCPVNMTLLSGNYYNQKHFLCDDRPNPGWVCGTNKYEEFAENFAVVTKYLIETKGYTCIKAIIPFNEPDSHIPNYGRTMWQGDELWADQYAPMAKALDAKFQKDGIRDKVQFYLSDNTDGSPAYLKSCTEALSDEADVFCSHVYRFGYTTPNSEIFDWEKQNVDWAENAGKTHYVGEFGSNETVGSSRQSDIDYFKRGILMTRIVLNCLQAGASGISYWGLFDQYYNRNDSYSQMQQLGLWRYVKEAYSSDSEVYSSIKEDYEVRPQYYAYSLLTCYIKPGSDVYPVDLGEEYAIGSAFKDESGKWTYVFANASDAQKRLAISNSDATGSFDFYEYAEETLPEGDGLIESQGTKKVKEGKLKVIVNPNTIMVCRQK